MNVGKLAGWLNASKLWLTQLPWIGRNLKDGRIVFPNMQIEIAWFLTTLGAAATTGVVA